MHQISTEMREHSKQQNLTIPADQPPQKFIYFRTRCYCLSLRFVYCVINSLQISDINRDIRDQYQLDLDNTNGDRGYITASGNSHCNVSVYRGQVSEGNILRVLSWKQY